MLNKTISITQIKNYCNKITFDNVYGSIIIGSAIVGGAIGIKVATEPTPFKEHCAEFTGKFVCYGMVGAWIGGSWGIFAPITIPLSIIGATCYKIKDHKETIEE